MRINRPNDPLIFSFVTLCLILVCGVSATAQELPCLRCHRSKNSETMVHVAVDFGCAVCHVDPHAEEKPELSLATPVPDLCYMCHADDIFTRRNQHTAVTAGLCMSCHNPHTSGNENLLVATGSGLCFGCHAETQFSKENQHVIVAAGMCDACHDPHSEAQENQLVAAGADLCFGCHDATPFQREIVHQPVSWGACENCHDPHASDTAFLLDRAEIELCLTCHAGQSSGDHFLPGIGYEHPIDGVADPSRAGRDVSCTSCHEPHAGDQAVLFPAQSGGGDDICGMCHSK